MALLQVNYTSHALQRTVPLQVILPTDKFSPDGQLPAPKQFKTLYLLHGLHGNYTDWVSFTRIQRWAQQQDLAVVMPSGDNSFYVDRPASGNNYADFIGRELVEVTRQMFPLSRRREDTYLGGLSMGGYGALRNGLKYHETFGAVISLSGAVDIMNMPKSPQLAAMGEALFDPPEQALRSDNNIRNLIPTVTTLRPRIYMSCGTEDGLLPQSRAIRDQLLSEGYDLTYEEGPGKHDWDFWDTYIKKALDWLL